MELALFFYLAGVVENVSEVIVALSLLTIFSFGCYTVFAAMHYDSSYGGGNKWETYYSTRKKLLKWAIVAGVALVLSGLVPSKNTMYTMAAAYGAQSIVENPDVKRLAGKSLDVLEGAMDKYIKQSNSGDKKDE